MDQRVSSMDSKVEKVNDELSSAVTEQLERQDGTLNLLAPVFRETANVALGLSPR